MDERACLFDIEAERPVELAVPMIDRVIGEKQSGVVADAVVVDSEVDGVGMRNVDGAVGVNELAGFDAPARTGLRGRGGWSAPVSERGGRAPGC